MRIWILTILLLAAHVTMAQDEPEYKMEIGAGTGLASYQGDLNGSLTANMQPMAVVSARLKPNPRMAWALEIGYIPIKGKYDHQSTYYPMLSSTQESFSNSVVDIGGRYEYNFWPYGTGREYKGAKRLVPYITGGIGLTIASTEGGSVIATNLPLGAGIKYKIAPRLNLNAAWIMHFTTSDNIDGVYDPYGIKSSGIFKNKDSYSMLQIALTYDIWAKCRTCHNDDF